MKTIGTKIKETKEGMLVHGMEELLTSLWYFYNECTEKDSFLMDLYSALSRQLATKDYADCCFKKCGKDNFHNSWIVVYRIDKENDLYILEINVFCTNPFVDKSVEKHLHKGIGIEYGLLSVDAEIEVASEGEKFFVDCDQLISCVKNALGEELSQEIIITGSEIVAGFMASEKYTLTHVSLLKSTDYEIWCSIDNAPGPYTFSWERFIWEAEGAILSGPRKYPIEGPFKEFLEETRGGREYNPIISIDILGTKLFKNYRRIPMLNPIKAEALEMESRIEKAFLAL